MENLENTVSNKTKNHQHQQKTATSQAVGLVLESMRTPSYDNLYSTTNSTKTTASQPIPQSSSLELDVHSNSLNWYLAECDRQKAEDLLAYKPNGSYLVRANLKHNSKYILSLVHEGQTKHILIEENASGCFIKSSFNQKRLQALNKPNQDDHMTRSSSTSSNYSTLASLIAPSMSSSSILNMSTGSDSGDYMNVSESSPSKAENLKFKTLTELVCYYARNYITIDNSKLNTYLIYPVLMATNTTTTTGLTRF
jgi:hypothetical protein